jgi:hypothetical protein
MNCRHCNGFLTHKFLDLGFAPPSNAYLMETDLSKPESFYPLKIMVCNLCWLVQTEDTTPAEDLFTPEYAYFSSTSEGWLRHAEYYTNRIIETLGINTDSLVIEVASNDGYLLKNFVKKGIPCFGVEPTISTSAKAEQLGIPVIREFFGEELAKRLVSDGNQADLIIGNNVYAHVPDINDFTRGLQIVLKPRGTVTLEFPHILKMISDNQFDTAYHEHFSYFSLYSVCQIFQTANLRIWNVEELTTHGGSLRIYGCHIGDSRVTTDAVFQILEKELQFGLQELSPYLEFQNRANKVKNDLLQFLLLQKFNGKTVAAYGAAAKGNTLLNYAGLKPDLLPFVCDAAIAKQGKFMPGSHIPILPPEAIREMKPDFVLILPWNITDEVMKINSFIRDWNGLFVKAIPELSIL